MNKKWTLRTSLATLILVTSIGILQAQTSPLSIPDISIIGRMSTKLFNQPEAAEHIFHIDEIELSLQGYIYPNVRSNVFIGIEHEGDEFNFGVEEAYLTVDTPFEIDRTSILVGKKQLNFGKINPLHAEQWKMPNAPAVITTLLGEEGLAPEGASIIYILPTPWFAQLEMGSWKAKSGSLTTLFADDAFAISGPLTNARLWTAWELSPEADIEIGLSGLLAQGPNYKLQPDNAQLYGIDITTKLQDSPTTSWLSQSEWISLNRANKTTVNGGYTYLGYQWNKYWDSGLRWDYVQGLTDDTPSTQTLAGVITNRLTETSKVSLQYTYDTNTTDSQVRIVLTFGLGPHSHNL